MNEMEMIQRTKIIIERLGAEHLEKLPFCSVIAGWQLNRLYTRNPERTSLPKKLRQHFGNENKVEHGHYSVQNIDNMVGVVYGNFRVINRKDSGGFYSFAYDITVIMKHGVAQRIILHGDRSEPVFCMINGSEDQIHMLKESEILYIESCRNDLLWHCSDVTVKCRGTLKELEHLLPKNFFRLQRSYIVNACHIKTLIDREVRMDNGDSLLIPIRSYCEMKKQIKKLCSDFGLI